MTCNGKVITWDKAGNKLAVKNLYDRTDDQRYAYDAAGRLTSYLRGQIPAGTIVPVNPALSGMQQMKRWAFDGLGNWIYTRQQTGEIVTAEQRMANAFNAYTAINKAGTTVNPSYNANGELEYDGEYNYIWDAWGRLTMIADDNYWEDPVARFVYDADNRQVRRMDFYSHEEGTNWAAHVYDYAYSGWRVLEEEKYRASYDNSSGYIDGFTDLGFRQNIYGNYLDEVIAVQIDGNGDGEAHEAVHDEDSTTGPDHRYYYCHNTLYSVIAITDEDADLVERYAYDPYGETYIYNSAGTKIAASLIDNVFTFTGQRFDPSPNINGYPKYLYYKNRYYLIPFGRFMSRDPIGYEGDIALYRLALNSPVTLTDPYGLKPCNNKNCGETRRCNVYIAFETIRSLGPNQSKAVQEGLGGADDAKLTKIPTRLLYSKAFSIVANVNASMAKAAGAMVHAVDNISGRFSGVDIFMKVEYQICGPKVEIGDDGVPRTKRRKTKWRNAEGEWVRLSNGNGELGDGSYILPGEEEIAAKDIEQAAKKLFKLCNDYPSDPYYEWGKNKSDAGANRLHRSAYGVKK